MQRVNGEFGELWEARQEFVKVVDTGTGGEIDNGFFVGGFLAEEMGEEQELLRCRAENISNVKSMAHKVGKAKVSSVSNEPVK